MLKCMFFIMLSLNRYGCYAAACKTGKGRCPSPFLQNKKTTIDKTILYDI